MLNQCLMKNGVKNLSSLEKHYFKNGGVIMDYSCSTCSYAGSGWHEDECGAMHQCINGSEYKNKPSEYVNTGTNLIDLKRNKRKLIDPELLVSYFKGIDNDELLPVKYIIEVIEHTPDASNVWDAN